MVPANHYLEILHHTLRIRSKDMVRRSTATVTAVGVFVFGLIVVKIALVIGLIYIACHFLSKWW